jgi:hypothetical protein
LYCICIFVICIRKLHFFEVSQVSFSCYFW